MKINQIPAQPSGNVFPGISFLMAAAVLIAAVSLVYTGYEYGLGNNVFHIPYVLSWDQLQAFHGNEFYLTLRYFTSAVWFLVRVVANEGNVETVFFVCHILTRVGTVFALLYLAWALGLKDRLGLILVGLGFVLSPLLLSAYSGGHDLFDNYFSHTIVTWPFVLMALADSQLRHFRRAAVFAGIVFLINAFVGIWLAFALVVGAIFNRDEHKKQDWWQLPAIFTLVCAPVVIWIAFALEAKTAVHPFSFREYIEAYFGGHFFLDLGAPARLIETAAIFVSAVWLCLELGKRRIAFVMAGFIAIFVVGIFLPELFDSRLIFNLHLLRVAGMVQFVFPLLALVVVWKRWQEAAWVSKASAALIGVSVINGMSDLGILAGIALPLLSTSPKTRWLWAMAISAAAVWLGIAVGGVGQLGAGQFVGLYCAAGILLLDGRTLRDKQAYLVLAAILILAIFSVITVFALHAGLAKYRYVAALALVWGFMFYSKAEKPRFGFLAQHAGYFLALSLLIQFAGVATSVKQRIDKERLERVSFASYFAMIDWLKMQPDRGPLLAPLEHGGQTQPDEAYFRYNLQLFSQKPVWVDWKQGAAVMWQPSFHEVWWPRFEAVKRLEMADEFYRYALSNHIRWLMLNDVDGPQKAICPGTAKPPAFINGRYRICLLD